MAKERTEAKKGRPAVVKDGKKFTLYGDQNVIEAAKAKAQSERRSLSQVIMEFLEKDYL